MCLSCAPHTNFVGEEGYLDGSSMQKYDCTVPQVCRGSVIYDEVILWSVRHEVTVSQFFSNRARILDAAHACWLLAAQ